MLTFILILYTAVSLAGIYLFILKSTGKKHKALIGIIHGAVGLLGIALLIFYVSFVQIESLLYVILIFLFTFLLGGAMFTTALFDKKHPKWLMYVHAAAALTGMILLILT